MSSTPSDAKAQVTKAVRPAVDALGMACLGTSHGPWELLRLQPRCFLSVRTPSAPAPPRNTDMTEHTGRQTERERETLNGAMLHVQDQYRAWGLSSGQKCLRSLNIQLHQNGHCEPTTVGSVSGGCAGTHHDICQCITRVNGSLRWQRFLSLPPPN